MIENKTGIEYMLVKFDKIVILQASILHLSTICFSLFGGLKKLP